MKIWMDYDVKEFDDDKVDAALAACKRLCEGCEIGWEQCLLSPNDCAVKDAVEPLSGMIRAGKGIKRYKEIKGLDG